MTAIKLFQKAKEDTSRYRLTDNEEILVQIDSSYQELFDLISVLFQMRHLKQESSLLRFIQRDLNLFEETALHFEFQDNGNFVLQYNPLLLESFSMETLLFQLETKLKFAFSEEATQVNEENEFDDKLAKFKEFLDHNVDFFQFLFELENKNDFLSPLRFYFDKVHKSTKNFSFEQNKSLLASSDKLKNFMTKLLQMLAIDFDIFDFEDETMKIAAQDYWKKEAFLLLRGKERGSNSLSEQLKISDREPHTLPWQKILELLVGTIPKGKRHTKTRLNRRQPLRADLSGILSDRKIHVVVAIDTSYSMDEDQLKNALNQVFTLKKKYSFEMTLIQCDSQIKDIKEINKISDIPQTLIGRGGTSFTPVIEYLNSHPKYRRSVLVYLTDGQGEQEIPKPKVAKVLWVLTKESSKAKLSLKESYGIIKNINQEAKL